VSVNSRFGGVAALFTNAEPSNVHPPATGDGTPVVAAAVVALNTAGPAAARIATTVAVSARRTDS
jgi:hypothetical protein